MDYLSVDGWKILEAPEGLKGHWITGEELGIHLGYADPRNSVKNIYNRNKKSFKEGIDTASIKLILPNGQAQETRVYSERGSLKVVRYSNTKESDAIMDQVFDVFVEVKNKKTLPNEEHPLIKQARETFELMQKYVAVEIEQKRLAVVQVEHTEKLCELQVKTEAYLDKSGFYSIAAYCRIMEKPATRFTAANMGKKATALSKEKDIEIGSVHDERWGKVNTYYRGVLDELFGDN